jgi:glucose/arabinose dehydrogenase
MRRMGGARALYSLISICAGAAWCFAPDAVAQVAPGPGVNPRAVWSEPPERFEMRVVASDLEDPWELTYGADGYLWVTERVGKRVVRIDPADGRRKVAVTIDEVQQQLGQDGLLGLALHPDFPDGSDFVYVMYTYDAEPGAAELRRSKIRRYSFDPASETLIDPVDLLTDIPHGPDHGASRIVIGPDRKLYASRGDHGANFLAYYCEPNRAQDLPVAADIAAGNWRDYQGKILRMNLDGTIPDDNPVLAGVRSHVFSYGHRNPQGMAFGPDGSLYAAEHGQDTDDEVNRIVAGGNYGWPPLKTFFTVPSTHDARASGNATAALTGLDVYASDAIPGWNPSILVASLVSGTIFRIPLNAIDEPPGTYFKAQNRYRDLAISPDGLRIYAITTSYGRTLTSTGATTADLEHPGSLLEFTYTGTQTNQAQ